MKKLIILISLVSCYALTAQTKDTIKQKKVLLSGSIDAYFRTNLNAEDGKDAIAPNTSFANLPGFALGMANLITQYNGKKVGFMADLVFGPRGEDSVFLSNQLRPEGSSNIVNQMYAYWNATDKLRFTLGSFNTFLGYEAISPLKNFHYSTTYLFSYGPFNYTGLKADMQLGEVSLKLGIMNPRDRTVFNPTGKYAFGGQIGYANQYLNVIAGNGMHEIDYTGSFNVSEKIFLGINAAYFETKEDIGFVGVALYPEYYLTENLAFGLRGEYFKEIGNFDAIGTGVEDSDVFVATLSANIKIEDLTIIPELRMDHASHDFYIDREHPKNNLASFVLAAVYKFD